MISTGMIKPFKIAVWLTTVIQISKRFVWFNLVSINGFECVVRVLVLVLNQLAGDLSNDRFVWVRACGKNAFANARVENFDIFGLEVFVSVDIEKCQWIPGFYL